MNPAATPTCAPLDALDTLDTFDQRRSFPGETVAAALGVSPGTVRGWMDRRVVRVMQVRAGAKRYIPLSELKRLALEDGWEVNVDALLEAD
jgi:hypothetical protein